jgi:hypothetical protein
MSDFFSWIGNNISQVGQFLNVANTATNLGNSLFGGGSSTPINGGTQTKLGDYVNLAAPQGQDPRNLENKVGPGRFRPAPVAGQIPEPGAIFKDRPESDPYLVSFRRIMNNNPGDIALQSGRGP